ncbi:MAG: hypothetical protein ACRDBX_05720 [Erysipelotrichaceae bacterium]
MKLTPSTKVYLLEYLAAIYRRNQKRQQDHTPLQSNMLFYQSEYNCYFENLERHLTQQERRIFQEAFIEGKPLSHIQMNVAKDELALMKHQVGVKIFDCIYQQF